MQYAFLYLILPFFLCNILYKDIIVIYAKLTRNHSISISIAALLKSPVTERIIPKAPLNKQTSFEKLLGNTPTQGQRRFMSRHGAY